MNKELIDDFIKKFPIPKGNVKNPYIILFDGYTGMGKSTIAKEFVKLEDAIILNNDEVRNFLNDYHDKNNTKDELQKYRLHKLLENNNNCICDSCFCHNYESKLKFYNSLGYKYFIIRIECSDKTIEKRLNNRKWSNATYSRANYNDYLWMKENVKRVPQNLIDFTINNNAELVSQLKNIIECIHKKML